MPEFHVAPLSKTLLVEGGDRRESFRGLVLAIGWWDAGGTQARPRWSGSGPSGPDLQYLVSDQTRPAPFWVDARQLTSQRWFPMLATPEASDAAADSPDAA